MHLGRNGVEMWRLGADCRRNNWLEESRRLLRLEVRFDRNHLLVKDAHDLNAVGFQNEKHNVLANLKAA